jgi:hypothetical protein
LVRVLATGFVPPAFAGFAIFDGQAIMTLIFQNILDPVALRPRLSSGLLFA